MNLIRQAPCWMLGLALLQGCSRPRQNAAPEVQPEAGVSLEDRTTKEAEIMKSDEEWKAALSPLQYAVLRQKGTERAFSGKYWNLKEDGTYVCAGCGAELFTSADKFDSGCGWPSYTRAVEQGRIVEHTDTSHGMLRTEVVCVRCGGHLGHVFDDGPAPTGKRYCINSASLDFKQRPK